MMTLAVFIDLKKAFDTVPHLTILKKLECLGIRGMELDWFISYMGNRCQYTVLDSIGSDTKDITVGVQQGSLLGVLLFQLLINDLPSSLKFCSSILYADDTTLYLYGKSLRFLQVKMQKDLDNLYIWLCANGLKLSVKKTKCMLMNSDGYNPEVSLCVDGQLIENVTNFKFLGVIIDSALKFEDHYVYIFGKLQQALFLVCKLSLFLPESCLRTLYYAYFHSYVSYCLIAWFPLLTKEKQNSIYVLQKHIVRAISNAVFNEHCMPLFHKLEILIISDQINLDYCRLMHRIDKNYCPVSVTYLFKKSVENYGTCSGSVNIMTHRLRKTNHSFLCKSVTVWLKLKYELKVLESTKTLCKLLKKEYLSKY